MTRTCNPNSISPEHSCKKEASNGRGESHSRYSSFLLRWVGTAGRGQGGAAAGAAGRMFRTMHREREGKVCNHQKSYKLPQHFWNQLRYGSKGQVSMHKYGHSFISREIMHTLGPHPTSLHNMAAKGWPQFKPPSPWASSSPWPPSRWASSSL